jgi:hypothetical protein
LLYRCLTGLFLLAMVAAIAISLRGQDWSVLATTIRQRRPGFFVLMAGLAFVANSAGLLASMVSWRAILAGVGEDVAAIDAARIFWVGQFAKYVPGSGFVVSIQMGRTIGVRPGRMISAWLLTLLISLLTGATVGLAAGPEVFGGSAAWLALAVLPIVAVLIRPELIGEAAVVATRWLRRPPLTANVSGPGVRRAVLAQLVAWLLGGVQLWFLALAMGAAPAGSFLLCVGAFSLGAVAGVIAVFAPDGIGVREVILLAALSLTLPLPVAGVVVLVSRLVVTLSELVSAGAGLLVIEALRRRQVVISGKKQPRHLPGSAGYDAFELR